MEKKPNVLRWNGVYEQETDTNFRSSLEDELQTIKLIQQGGKERDIAVEKLSTSKSRLVTAIARRYVNNGPSIAELISAGNKGLVIAAEKFKPSRGFKFTCYAIWWVKQCIEKEIEERKSQEQ